MRTIALLALLVASPAAAETLLTLDPAASQVTYHVVHKFHRVDGKSKSAQGRARVGDDGTAQAEVRVPVESFDSGNVNRDAHMKEVTEAARYPSVDLKAIAHGVTPPASLPSTVRTTVKAQLTFHGVTQVMDVPVELAWESAGRLRVKGQITLSLDAFKVERPSLLFVKIDDALVVDVDLSFKQ
jgi:polyisoprenoid-binding protein YceI